MKIFLDICWGWGHHKVGLVLGIISLYLRVNAQNGDILGGANFHFFWGGGVFYFMENFGG